MVPGQVFFVYVEFLGIFLFIASTRPSITKFISCLRWTVKWNGQSMRIFL